MNENAKRCRATLLIGLSLLFVGAINGADDRHVAQAALNSTQAVPAGQLTLADRVAYQYAIEEVYWRHRIWPAESGRPKPSLDHVISAAQIQRKVEDYLRDSELLADYWRRPITSGQLQAEVDRMASQTKQPEVLQEVFAALNNDPRLIAECLARPALAERLVRSFDANDERSHGELKRRPENAAARAGIESIARYSLPQIADGSNGCADNTWRSTRALDVRLHHTAVWTGVEMIIWGGADGEGDLRYVSNTGWRYNPTTDSWVPTNVIGAPLARSYHTAVWTGTEMIVWGGTTTSSVSDNTNTGGRYNPSTDSWVATSTNGAPSERHIHTAVWTGNEMIVWGGLTYNEQGEVHENTGARYNPNSDSWVATSSVNTPSARADHTAVWADSEMIVWGGHDFLGNFNTGGRYDPISDSWVATNDTGAPLARSAHTAVWTGTELIVWGGRSDFGNTLTGGRYNPSTNSWVATRTTGAPSGRVGHTAVWTGVEMIVWGGKDSYFRETGGKYNPTTDSWVAMDFAYAPEQRWEHTAVWTGTEMIVWGGSRENILSTGGRYTPSTNSWVPTSIDSAPQSRVNHTAVWTGTEMIIWGGSDSGGHPLVTGGRYFPSTDSWIATSTTDVPDPRFAHTAVWTGTEMIVWGGYYLNSLGYNPVDVNTGGRYNPTSDSWIATSIIDAPRPRDGHTAVWTGAEMIVWGGYVEADRGLTGSGGRYNPNTNSWVAMSRSGAPEFRYWHTAIWTGSEMIIWGGTSPAALLGNGGRYDPTTDSWLATSMSDAPVPRAYHTAVWTGTEMIIWGGYNFEYASLGGLNTGARYIPTSDSWAATASLNAPEGRSHHTAVWIGGEMIVWGGAGDFSGDQHYQNTGARYSPGRNSWIATSTTTSPDPGVPIPSRSAHTAIWTGTEMIVWGGYNGSVLNTGGRYCAQLAPAHLDNISTRLAVGTGNYNLIGGFIISGTQPKRVLIRALGPSVPVSGILADPVLELHPSAGEVITNDNWRDSQEAEIIASGKAPTNNAESAIIATLAPGAHTAIVRGTNETTGMGLMEVWDLDSDSSSTMANVSTRGFVQTGDNVMIGGTIIIGGGTSNLLVRAIGPSLSSVGLPNPLGDPNLELYDGNGAVLATNDNWRDTQEAAIQATGLAPINDLDSAILQSVSSGAYTAIVRGNNGTTGIALVEIYALP